MVCVCWNLYKTRLATFSVRYFYGWVGISWLYLANARQTGVLCCYFGMRPNHFALHFAVPHVAAFWAKPNCHSFAPIPYSNDLTQPFNGFALSPSRAYSFSIPLVRFCLKKILFNWYCIITWGARDMTEEKTLIKILICDIKTIWFFFMPSVECLHVRLSLTADICFDFIPTA